MIIPLLTGSVNDFFPGKQPVFSFKNIFLILFQKEMLYLDM